MARSSGIPRGRGLRGITRIISARTTPTTITRPNEQKGSLDQTEEFTSTHQEDLWVFAPNEQRIQSLAGERLTGDLAALAIADGTVDVQPDDRLTHGGVEYEVDSVEGRPDDAETDYWTISLIRRH